MEQQTALDKFFEELGKKGKGRFHLEGSWVRHKKVSVCPIEFMYARKSHRSLAKVRAGDLDVMTTSLGIHPYLDDIIRAADRSEVVAYPLRVRMLKVLGLD